MSLPLSRQELEFLALCTVGVVVAQGTKKRRRRKKKWANEFLLEREKRPPSMPPNETKLLGGGAEGEGNVNSNSDTEDSKWFDSLRLDEETYRRLLTLVAPRIRKKDTCMRRSITPHERLSATLQFLATGSNYETMMRTTVISGQALSRIIPETCLAIWDTLKDQYIKLPSDENEWSETVKQLKENSNFPNCLGVIGGRKVSVAPPTKAVYFGNLRINPVFTLAGIVNAHHEFLFCDFGIVDPTPEELEEGLVEDKNQLYQKMKEVMLKSPSGVPPSAKETELPFVFVGGEAFKGLSEKVLTAYPEENEDENLTEAQRMFNDRLTNAESIADRVFEVMHSRFQIFKAPIKLKMETTSSIVLACCALHNFLLKWRGDDYLSGEDLTEISTFNELGLADFRRDSHSESSGRAGEIRERYTEHFTTSGHSDFN